MNTQHFVAQVAIFSGETPYVGGDIGMIDPGEVAERVLPHLRGGQLFAYLFRRFGYPTHGWDGYKELVSYTITTPVENLVLRVTPYLGSDAPPGYEPAYDSTPLMFGCAVLRETKEEYLRCIRQKGFAAWSNHPLYHQCLQAIEIALLDLLRPVFVRDVPVNCYGRVENEENLLECVEFSATAGYALPSAFFKSTERYKQFCEALQTLGNGSFEQGIENMLKTASTLRYYQGSEQEDRDQHQ